MIPKECKRLAEVDFPIAVVSKHSAREKSIRHGHPSTLHLWWARRPLAACRAMLLGLLLPDPCDPHCPEEFKTKARKAFDGFLGIREGDDGLRKALLTFIGDVADWDVANNPRWIGVARQLVKAAHPDETPLVVDPFAGGGSIPLEALRLGCDAFASDLNPVACLINKVLLEDIPRHGPKLAEELRRAGAEIKKQAEKELAEYYPPDPDGARPIAYLWARTARCEQPNCGCDFPLVRSFWLRKKSRPRQAVRMNILREYENGPTVSFEVFTPGSDAEVPGSTVFQGRATCPACNAVLQAPRLRSQMIERHGGIEHLQLIAVVLQGHENSIKTYRAELPHDQRALKRAAKALEELSRETKDLIPSESIPLTELRRVAAPLYGCTAWSHLFTQRQRLGLATIAGAISSRTSGFVRELAVLAFGKVVRHWNSNARWHNGSETVAGAFGRQAIPMSWTFPEQSMWMAGAGSMQDAIRGVAEAIEGIERLTLRPGQIAHSDACALPLPSASTGVWFTDPPYYDAVAYAHLADFFYVWFKRLLPPNAAFSTALIDKEEECVVDRAHSRSPSQKKTAAWFEAKMAAAMSDGFRVLVDDGIGSVVFAHKSTQGWEALIGGMLQAGWVITASWPITTERGARLNARDNASLAASVHLVCRPRPEDAPVGDWGEVLRELPKRIGGGVGDLPAPRRDRYYVYVLKCADDSFYIGQTDDVRRRFGEHQSGKVSWTKARQPLEVIHWEEFNTREQAVEREQRLKTGFGRQWLKREYEKGKLAARQAGWMERLQGEGIRGADLVFACIGPALEIFSRYSKVETADGREVKLDAYLEKVWEVVGRTALEQVLGTAEAKARNGAAGAVEEDARLTALFLWTLQSTNGNDQSRDAHQSRDREGAEIDDAADDDDDDDTGEDARATRKANLPAPRASRQAGGYSLVFDVVRRFAQPLGIDLPKWEGRVIETKKGVVRLMAVSERAKQLFGEDGADAVADWIVHDPQKNLQQVLFPELEEDRAPKIRGRGRRRKAVMDPSAVELAGEREATTLDRVHAAMLLQMGGQANALRQLIKAEQERGPDFLRLANALSALYPKGSEEKRLLDAMLLGVSR